MRSLFRLSAFRRGDTRSFVLALALVAGVALSSTQVSSAPGARTALQAPPARVFDLGAGVILSFVKADQTAIFEGVMAKVKEALQKGAAPMRKEQAAGWKVFKAAEPGPNNSVVYVMMIDPAVKGADYMFSTILSEAFPQEAQKIYKDFADSLVGQQPFSLQLVSNFAQ